MVQLLELPEQVYELLRRVAAHEGLTPAQWIEARISEPGTGAIDAPASTLAEALAPSIGAVDSTITEPDKRYRTEFGDLLDEKFAKQGITRPQWQP